MKYRRIISYAERHPNEQRSCAPGSPSPPRTPVTNSTSLGCPLSLSAAYGRSDPDANITLAIERRVRLGTNAREQRLGRPQLAAADAAGPAEPPAAALTSGTAALQARLPSARRPIIVLSPERRSMRRMVGPPSRRQARDGATCRGFVSWKSGRPASCRVGRLLLHQTRAEAAKAVEHTGGRST